MTFDFVVFGVPLSKRADGCSRREATVKEAAFDNWPYLEPPTEGNVSLVLVYLHFGDASRDVDNMAKPVIDALRRVIYKDDMQIVQLIVRKTRMTEGLELSNPPPALAGALADARARGQDFVYVATSGPPDHGKLP
jgi:Endodeoxyribonuclease RusA